MWTLLGIAVVVAGFAFRFNPLLVIAAAAAVTGIAGGMHPLEILAAFGKAFNDTRYISAVFVVLPVIGLMERAGLQQRARILIGRLRGATASHILFIYFVYRQITSAVGLTAAGGHAQMVRPLIAPMAESAAEAGLGGLSDGRRWHIRAFAAATENVAVFFSEDIFIALAPVLLIQGTLAAGGIVATPLSISLWAIPTALLALTIHGLRIALFGRALRRKEPPA
ncbi:MAG TPA: DUF969 domain-containing protein [Rhizomicrobium sp.]|nr:DUF969 domain-containing protein [Rhizomicrobium sp.]